MNASRTRLQQEDGWAVVIAIVIMGLMLGLGLALLSLSDTQQKQSKRERNRESSFNLAEGALQQQGYRLAGAGWPRTAATQAPVSCTPSNTNSMCPNPVNLVPAAGTGAYNTSDYAAGATWTTSVRDNVARNDTNYVTSAVESTNCANNGGTAPCRWDANGDDLLWVRAEATVRGKKRTLVALLRRERFVEAFPKNVLLAGHMNVGQNGQSPVITTAYTGTPIASSQVVVRCVQGTPDCTTYLTNQGDSQVQPESFQYDPSRGTAVPQDVINRLTASATRVTTCPTEAQMQGLVWYDPPAPAAKCVITLNSNVNSPQDPGMFIVSRGQVEFRGNASFYGVIYHLNLDNVSSTLIDMSGTGNFYGGIAIDGPGGFLNTGNARLYYDPNMFVGVRSAGAAGLVQNTWRELPPEPGT
jgi:Tfp pilus assembly protein PilX